MKKNRILISLIFICLVLGIIIFTIFHFKSTTLQVKAYEIAPKEKNNDKIIQISEEVSKTELVSFFQDFIKAYNSNKEENINRFIDEQDGFVEQVYEGPYPLILFRNEMDYIEWFRHKISENVSADKFPEYLGDTQFEKTGFFYEKYENKFKLSDFNNDYVNLSDTVFKSHHILEEKCNYRALAMDVRGKLIYNFYFSITKDKKKLVGLSYDYIEDNIYSDPTKNFIPFDTKQDIENFIETQKKFCDIKNKSYLDFEKKEFTYWDFEGPFVFKIYDIGEIEIQSKKIKIRKIKFYTNEITDDYDQYFTMELSNKGTFFVRPMGARPQYEYNDCE